MASYLSLYQKLRLEHRLGHSFGSIVLPCNELFDLREYCLGYNANRLNVMRVLR